MISSVVVFVLAFAAMGLLLGFAATMETHVQRPPVFKAGSGTNSTSSLSVQEHVNATVERAQGS
jgi:hypothetical protein